MLVGSRDSVLSRDASTAFDGVVSGVPGALARPAPFAECAGVRASSFGLSLSSIMTSGTVHQYPLAFSTIADEASFVSLRVELAPPLYLHPYSAPPLVESTQVRLRAVDLLVWRCAFKRARSGPIPQPDGM
ncbi:hypothetical protein HETIRDRAFT_330795 [Heterobasidion irregulare TC 32-1]|uniref:Uncharacterized protein n=1 Tax=Heterobasidion irregulare (strain TC 32-1) TaxID=747525 RepID=W4JP74_HETIT|nr:uncharacterized protein HETIRDRAFT_330795 [Heterobasidion irregulare TC 32-1]ETW75328.1 hypothetical protein HETIRDRAFT_330795 [Heterobasidion irregulare TC 32-1]